jgi:hypothetical protein
MQLPVHPLINHAVAVLVPVSALGAILLVVFAKLRSNYSLLLLITVISASISAFIAENSGQALANRVGSPGEHAIQGERLFKIVLVFTLIYTLWFAIHKKYIVIKGAQRVINTGLSATLVATAVASAALTFIVGHSGAAATWEDRIAASVTQPLAPDSPTADGSGKSPSSGKVNLVASEISKHSTAKDCWSIVNGNVYNLTTYVQSHPGGAGVIKNICGRDGSGAFKNQHGSSSKPNNVLSAFLLGSVGSQISSNISQSVITPPAAGAGNSEEGEEEEGDED